MSPEHRLITNNAIRAVAFAAREHEFGIATDLIQREASYARGLIDGIHAVGAIDDAQHRRLIDRLDTQFLASMRSAVRMCPGVPLTGEVAA